MADNSYSYDALRNKAFCNFGLIYSVTVLLIVWGLELVGGYLPCQLCLWQRVPWYLILLISSLAKWLPPRMVGACLLVLFASSMGLAGFHSGVEMLWWEGLTTCSGGDLPLSMADFQQQLENDAPIVRCDVPALLVAGLSLSDGNLIASLLGFLWVARSLRAQRATSNGMKNG